MAQDPEEYRDGRGITADRATAMEWVRAVLEAVALVVLLAWFLGWLGAEAAPLIQPTDGTGFAQPDRIGSGTHDTL